MQVFDFIVFPFILKDDKFKNDELAMPELNGRRCRPIWDHPWRYLSVRELPHPADGSQQKKLRSCGTRIVVVNQRTES